MRETSRSLDPKHYRHSQAMAASKDHTIDLRFHILITLSQRRQRRRDLALANFSRNATINKIWRSVVSTKNTLPVLNYSLTNFIAQDVCEDNTSFQDSIVEPQRQSHAAREANHEDPRARQIAPQQNWLAKLFHVKPAAKFICFTVSKRRARQEITTILREWKRYGLRDVQVDKERNIVFGRVASKNCKL